MISGCVVLGFCGLGFGVDEKMKMMKDEDDEEESRI